VTGVHVRQVLGAGQVHVPHPARGAGPDFVCVHRRRGPQPLGALDAIMSAHGFGDLPDLAGQILAGQVRGRFVTEIGR
jgi:hypothetical protein